MTWLVASWFLYKRREETMRQIIGLCLAALRNKRWELNYSDWSDFWPNGQILIKWILYSECQHDYSVYEFLKGQRKLIAWTDLIV